MQDLKRICHYLVKRGHLSKNIMEDHIWRSKEKKRREILEEDNERLTWAGKLNDLFRTPIYQSKLQDVGDPMFWAPLIALHMGLRSEEILQLYLDDIQVIDDIPCIVLRQGPGQHLKSDASRRTVPIHDNLLKLGFMQLVALRRREGEPRLFPWLERSQSKKTFTENFSKRFTKYRKDHGIYDPNRDFHSFQPTFNDLVILAERQESHRRAIMGHVQHDVGITNYNPSGFSIKTLRDCVNAVDIDVSMIRSPFTETASASVTELSTHRTKSSA
ncbi:site-specific integrase [Jannaschia sp. 2305UL9-9]|uniref:site-specific integrase n=1 Tax=Jannaschia sp. 2305UL9-9 TaxID=3121638 RepID=UPI0035298DFE